MGSISHHITPLVTIASGGDKHKHTHTHTFTDRSKYRKPGVSLEGGHG